MVPPSQIRKTSRLIINTLQIAFWFKRGTVLLSIPRTEALALPIEVEQTTPEPTPYE